jgi:hypothetical protein
MGNANRFTINCQGESAPDGEVGIQDNAPSQTVFIARADGKPKAADDAAQVCIFPIRSCSIMHKSSPITSADVPTCEKRQKGEQNDRKQQIRLSPLPLWLRAKIF